VTRKDFVLIAGVIEALGPSSYRAKMAEAFALRLRSTNPRFDTARFLVACGVHASSARVSAEAIERQVSHFASP
jgi:hypothetical protein